MSGRCCGGGVRQRTGAAASIVPGAALVLLPKCPLCVAAWLGVATGVSVSAAAAAYVRDAMVVLCVAGLAFIGLLALRNFVTDRNLPL